MTPGCAHSRLAAWVFAVAVFVCVVLLPASSAGASSTIEQADGEQQAFSTTTTQSVGGDEPSNRSDDESAGITEFWPVNTTVGRVVYPISVLVVSAVASALGILRLFINRRHVARSKPHRSRRIRPLLQPSSRWTIRDIEQTGRIPVEPTVNRRGRVSWMRRLLIWDVVA